jgi:hypothetical protein
MTKAPAADIPRLLATAAERCAAADRDDLAEKIRLAATRSGRPSTVVCVVGDYKQGKSHLLNALVGADVCPVHDDLATSALTIVHHADTVTAQVRRSRDGEVSLDEIPVEAVGDIVTEQGDPDSRRTVEHVSIGVPSSILSDGLVLVDTPGVGGLAESNRRAVLGFLPYADAVVFVSDASAELSLPEIEFLKNAAAVCPSMMMALTKVDLYGEWERIAELDELHLRDAALNVPIVSVSSTMSRLGAGNADDSLEHESRVPALSDLIVRDVVAGSRERASVRALEEAGEAMTSLQAVVESERAVLSDPSIAAQRLEDLERAQQALKNLRASGSRWSVVLQDGFADLRSTIDFELRSGIRELLRRADEELAGADPRSHWEDYTEELKGSVAGLVEEVVTVLDRGSVEVAERVAALVSAAAPLDVQSRNGLDVESIWEAVQWDLSAERGRLTAGLSALRGMQSGVIMLGLVGQLVGLTLMLPVVLGGGALLGVKQVADERERRLERRRNEARTLVRQFLDQVQFEMGSRLQQAVAEMQRSLRDVIASRVSEMQETCRLELTTAERGVNEHVKGREARLRQLEGQSADLATLQGQLAAAQQALDGETTS